MAKQIDNGAVASGLDFVDQVLKPMNLEYDPVR